MNCVPIQFLTNSECTIPQKFDEHIALERTLNMHHRRLFNVAPILHSRRVTLDSALHYHTNIASVIRILLSHALTHYEY